MSREIKFRAWVTEYASEETPGYMIELPANKLKFDCEDGFVLAFGDYGFWACECYEDRKPKFEVMQFTGQEDAMINGQDVYESDIIENCDTKDLQVVYWNEEKAAWYCRYVNDEKHVVPLSDSLGNLNKKVGNIYENPDLLK